jgi:methyl-accepting chemotaxis protein
MVGIREGLDRQNQRQEDLLEHLARLPAILEQLPENSRMHGETLKALHQELAGQHDQQKRLTEILDHVSKSSVQQKDVLEGLQDRVDRMRQTDEQIASNLNNVGTTMQELGRSTSTGAQILESMRDNISSRDNELQQVLLRQGARFTVMLSIAIFLSIAALVAVAVVGWLMLNRGQ